MNRSFLQFDYSGWWVLAIIVIAAGLSFFLYTKKNVPWTQTQNWILASIRFLAISFLLLLFISPTLRNVTNTVEKPIIGIALDNSASVIQREEDPNSIVATISQIEELLGDSEFEVEITTFSDSLVFNENTTSLSTLLNKVERKHEDQNLAAILLASDGIYNRGSSPLYENYLTPVFTLGLGDTIPPKDISISRTLYNRVTYKGNDTPINLEISQEGYNGQKIMVQLLEKGTLLKEERVTLRSSIQEVVFTIPSPNEGLRHLVASVTPLEEETTLDNNESNIFMEVIDGRQKVLVVANSPHPDIKAIRNVLESTGNYETSLYIPRVDNEKPSNIFDVVIFHGAFTSGINYTPKGNPGLWYILSNESSITTANKTLPFLKIERRGSRPDKVAGAFNEGFTKFKIEDHSAFKDYPPIEVPFGNYSLSGPVEVLMYQKLGSITTQKPLMAVFDDGLQKSAVLLGQNIWKWRLQEAAINDQAAQFENLITKTIQYLSVKNDKKQFRFKARENTIRDTEPALFDAEVYNDIYERIYDNEIKVWLTSENGETSAFEFTNTRYNSTFRSPILSAGIYKYKAEVKVGEHTFTDQGEFSVQNINPEVLQLTADHRLLRNLSARTGGHFAKLSDWGSLIDQINESGFKSVLRSEEELVPLSQAWWWYFIIFVLFSSEWFLRKYWGGY